jgi:hypothetical protein
MKIQGKQLYVSGSKMLLMTDNAHLRVKGFNSVQTLITKVELAIDLLKRSQSALSKGGGLRLHKIVSNSEVVL